MRKRKKQHPQVSSIDEELKQEFAKSENSDPLEGELITGPREYEVLKPIIHRGERKSPGDTVKLNDHQAEGLIGSGHIQQ